MRAARTVKSIHGRHILNKRSARTIGDALPYRRHYLAITPSLSATSSSLEESESLTIPAHRRNRTIVVITSHYVADAHLAHSELASRCRGRTAVLYADGSSSLNTPDRSWSCVRKSRKRVLGLLVHASDPRTTLDSVHGCQDSPVASQRAIHIAVPICWRDHTAHPSMRYSVA